MKNTFFGPRYGLLELLTYGVGMYEIGTGRVALGFILIAVGFAATIAVRVLE